MMETYYIVVILMIAIPIIAQINISANFNKYKKISVKNKLSGFEAARGILDANGLSNIHIVEVRGHLSDHYDPRRKVIRLSTDIFHGETIAAVAVASHEVGHAIQDKEGYTFMRIRSMIVPVVNITSYVGYILIVISMLLSAMNMFWLAIGLMAFSIVFQVITLPVEYNASSKAEEQVQKLNLVDLDEVNGVKKMLGAAALTYVASLLTQMLQIVRLVMVMNGRSNRR